LELRIIGVLGPYGRVLFIFSGFVFVTENMCFFLLCAGLRPIERGRAAGLPQKC